MTKSIPEKKRTVQRPKILALLGKHYPDARCALLHRDPWELLVATILSAQCTDTRVNLVTPPLFRRFPTVKDMAAADLEEIEQLVQSTGFFRAKAKNIRKAAQILMDHFRGEIPREMDDLLTLPGVARKTANVVLGTGFGITSGIVVDTHVSRIAQRWGWTKEIDPPKIEQDLMQIVPREHWILFSHQAILHGRRICAARKPLCQDCPFHQHCPSATGQEIHAESSAGGKSSAPRPAKKSKKK